MILIYDKWGNCIVNVHLCWRIYIYIYSQEIDIINSDQKQACDYFVLDWDIFAPTLIGLF